MTIAKPVLSALAIALFVAPHVPAPRDEVPAVPLGTPVGNLHFKDTRYLPRSLDDFKDKKAFALVFTNTSCPVAQRYLPVLREMEKEYRGKGVQFLAVYAAAEDTIPALAAQ